MYSIHSAYSSSAAITKFSKTGSSHLRARGNQPLEMEAIRQVAPSVFAEQKHSSRSEQYTYIPTSDILTALAKEGFRPFSVTQGGSRDEEKKGFTKHLIRLRHESAMDLSTVGQTANEIILLNSHDGTSSYQMMGGVFRLVCSNGMVVSDGTVQKVRVPHKGDIAGQVIDGCIEILREMPQVSESVREMQAIEFSRAEQEIFARAAHTARYDVPATAPIEASRLLNVRRREDAAPTIWNTLNAVQENVIQGGLRYVQRDNRGYQVAQRKTRPVGGIDQNTQLNRILWAVAEEMKALKSQA